MNSHPDANFQQERDHYRGILTIAHTKDKYVKQAVNLAISIRLYNPEIAIAVATNLSSELFNDYFDQVILWDFSDLPGLVSKLSIYEMSPFNETLFIDADCLVIKSLDSVFEYFSKQNFAVFGINTPHPRWFLDVDRIKERVPSDTYPGFNGGIYYFKKSELARQVFQSAKDLLVEYDDLKIQGFSGFPGEEPLISLAMAKMGLLAIDDGKLDVMYAPAGIQGGLNIDVLAGQCSFKKYGRLVKPYIMHFASDDTCYEYLREELRLRAALRESSISAWQETHIRYQARIKWVFVRFIPLYSLFFANKIKKIFAASEFRSI